MSALRIVGPDTITLDEIAATIAGALSGRTTAGVTPSDAAQSVVDAVADLVATMPEGLAVALTRWRSELCGAADVLPHIEAERDRLKAESERLRDELRLVTGERENLRTALDAMNRQQVRTEAERDASWIEAEQLRLLLSEALDAHGPDLASEVTRDRIRREAGL